jgi:hypothetical protein
MAVCAVLTGKSTHKAQNPWVPCFPRIRPLFAPTTMLNVLMVLAIPQARTHWPTGSRYQQQACTHCRRFPLPTSKPVPTGARFSATTIRFQNSQVRSRARASKRAWQRHQSRRQQTSNLKIFRYPARGENPPAEPSSFRGTAKRSLLRYRHVEPRNYNNTYNQCGDKLKKGFGTAY